jgi:hypothetical protein
MLDYHVAYKTLAQFDTADEIADFFRSEGIQAARAMADSCAISKWMTDTTGMEISTNLTSVRAVRLNQEMADFITIEGTYQCHTEAMRVFVEKFDGGQYPDLIADRHDAIMCARGIIEEI